MQKTFYIFCTLLHTLSLSADNGSIGTGTALFGASIALVVGSQKFKNNSTYQCISRTSCNNNVTKSIKKNSRIPTKKDKQTLNKNNYEGLESGDLNSLFGEDLPLIRQQNNTRKKETPLLIKFNEEWHKKDEAQKLPLNYLFYGKTLPILPRTVFQKIKEETWEKSPEPLFLTYTPQWHEEQKLIEKINECYKQSDINRVLEITSKHTTRFSHNEKENETFFLNQQNKLKSGRTSIKHTISPKNKIATKVIILISLHGTWGNGSSFGGNLKTTLSQAYVAYAEQLSIKENAIVYFNVIDWDGNITQECRKKSGENLATELEKEFNSIKNNLHHTDISIQAIGHSHGCNVISFAANKLKEKKITINKATFFGCPGSDVESENIDKIVNIIGNADFMGTAGTIVSSYGQSSSMFKENLNVKNITLTHEGNNLDHTAIKYIVMNNLPLIEQCCDENFTKERYLCFDIFNQKTLIKIDETQNENDDKDENDLVNSETVNNAIPHNAINCFIDASKSVSALDENDNDFQKSQKNEQKFKSMYEKSPYKTTTIVGRFNKEITPSRIFSLIWSR